MEGVSDPELRRGLSAYNRGVGLAAALVVVAATLVALRVEYLPDPLGRGPAVTALTFVRVTGLHTAPHLHLRLVS